MYKTGSRVQGEGFRGRGVGHHRKSTLTRVAWSLRTGPRTDLVLDHVTVGLSHYTNFLPRTRPPQTNFITLTSGLTNPLTPYLAVPPLLVCFPKPANGCASRRTGSVGANKIPNFDPAHSLETRALHFIYESWRRQGQPIGDFRMELSRLWPKRPIPSAGGVFESEAKEGGNACCWELSAGPLCGAGRPRAEQSCRTNKFTIRTNTTTRSSSTG